MGGGVGVGLRRPPLADVGSIQIKSNAAVNTEQVFSNIAVYTHAGRVGRDPTKESNGKTTRERLRDCYLSAGQLTTCGVEKIGRRGVQLYNTLLIDLLPEPAAIRDIWENKLTLVKGERAGSVVATER